MEQTSITLRCFHLFQEARRPRDSHSCDGSSLNPDGQFGHRPSGSENFRLQLLPERTGKATGWKVSNQSESGIEPCRAVPKQVSQ